MSDTHMVSFAHIVNPVAVQETSHLHVAQPITFESMRVARRMAHDHVAVRQLVTCYAEDGPAAPPDFEQAGLLDRSVMDLVPLTEPRKLPLLRDILDRLHAASDGCTHLIYTNVDVSLMPTFYSTVALLISRGHEALAINRRTIDDQYRSPDDLPLMYAEPGRPHAGHDCFVFPRAAYPRFQLGRSCLGVPPVGKILLLNLAAFAPGFQVFEEMHATFHVGDHEFWRRDELTTLGDFNHAEAEAVLDTLEREVHVHERGAEFARWSRRTRRYLEKRSTQRGGPSPLRAERHS